jgi:hypothetical protein
VVRQDSLVDKDQENYQRILEDLESRFKKPAAVEKFGDLYLARYVVR